MTHSLEAERSVLGSILTYGDKAVEVVQDEGLKPEHFWWDSHACLARVCFELHALGLPVDDITVARKLEGSQFDKGIIATCVWFSRPSSLRAHARFVVEDHEWRLRFRQAEELMNAVKTRNESAWQRLIRGERPALRVVKEDAA